MQNGSLSVCYYQYAVLLPSRCAIPSTISFQFFDIVLVHLSSENIKFWFRRHPCSTKINEGGQKYLKKNLPSGNAEKIDNKPPVKATSITNQTIGNRYPQLSVFPDHYRRSRRGRHATWNRGQSEDHHIYTQHVPYAPKFRAKVEFIIYNSR